MRTPFISETPRRVVIIGTIGSAALLLFIIGGPLLLAGNPEAQALLGILVALMTTVASIVATRAYARAQAQDQLTRYGLQAWRNLDALSLKLTKRIGTDGVDTFPLEEWLLDVDQAKLAWRDLLREVFELQHRLESETEEVALRTRVNITATFQVEGERV